MNVWLPIIEELFIDLTNELHVILTTPGAVARYSAAARCCLQKGEHLRQLIDLHAFEDKATEIWFFKEGKTKFAVPFLEYNLYHKLYLNWPASRLAQEHKVRLLNDRIQTWYHDNDKFICYHESHSTVMDEFYYLRCNYDPMLNFDEGDAWNDPAFCTNFDHMLSRYLAYRKAEQFIHDPKVYEPEGISSVPAAEPVKKLPWPGTDNDFVEMLYLHAEASRLRFGSACIKDIYMAMTRIYEVDIPVEEIYRKYRNMCGRKKALTPWTIDVAESLSKRMREHDEK